MKLTIRALFAMGLLLLSGKLSAQLSSTGKLFFLSFMEMEARTGGYPDSLLVYITSEVNTTVTIDNPRIGGTAYNVSITAGKVNRVSLDPQFYYPQGYEKPSSDIESKRSVRIVAKDPINVYTLNLELNRSDGTFVLPYESIPKAPEFRIAAFTPTQTAGAGKYMPSEFVVVAMDNNVTVEITPSTKLESGKTAGSAFTVTLAKGQVYQVQSAFADGSTSNPLSTTGDLTGSRVRVINGCGKITVFSGMRSVRIPSSTCGIAVDHLYTQVFPINILGTQHVLTPFMTNSKGYVFKVIATKANTKIYVDGTYIGSTKNAGQFYYEDVTSAIAKCVTSDSAVMVVQYMKNGGTCSGTTGNYGDPAILIMPDYNQKMLKTVVGTATTNNMNKHYLNILVKKSAKAAVKLNGTYLNPASFVDVTCANHSYIQVNVANPSTNTVECDSGLIVVVYGLGQYESYAYCAGALFESLDYDFSIKRTSQCPNNPVTMTAITNAKNVKKYIWNFGDGFQDTGKQVVHSFKKTGSFYVTMKAVIPVACGSNDTIFRSKIITIKPGPLYNMPDTLFQCTNSLSIPFTAPSNVKYLYKWQDSSTKNTYTAKGPGKVWLRITDTSTNCLLYDSTLVQQFNPIDAKPGYDTAISCFHTNHFVLSDSTVYKSDALKSNKWLLKRWLKKDSIFTNTKFRYVFDSVMTYNLTYIVNSKNGCVDTTNFTLDVVKEPNVKFWTLKPEYCQKESALFRDSSAGQGGIATGYWDFGDGTKSTGKQVNHSYLTAGTFNVRLITESTYKCRDTVDSAVVVNPLPVMAMTVTNNNVCKKANSFSFTDGSTISSGTISNTWKYLNKTGSGVTTLANIFFPDTGTWTMRLFNTSAKGCTDSIKKTVYVAPEPKAIIAVIDSSLCFKGHFYTLDDQSTLGKGTFAGRTWTFSDATTSTSKTVTNKTFATYGNYNVKLVVRTSTYNCRDSVTRSLVVHSSPLAPFSVNATPQCLTGNNFTFTPNSTFNVSGVTANYNWDFGDANTANTATPSHTYATANTFNVKFIISTSQNCADTATKAVTVNLVPKANFQTSKDSACLGTYKFDFTNATVFGSGYNNKWYLGDATTATTTDVMQKSYPTAGTFMVKLVTTSNTGGCKDSIVKSVVVMPVPKADFTINNPSQCLASNSFVFNNTTQTNGATGMNWQWVFTPGATFNTQNIASQTMPDTGNYTIKLTSTSGFGCTDNITKSIYVAESPTVTISGNDACTGDDIQFTAVGKINSGSIVSYGWTFGDGGVSSQQNPLHRYNSAGTWNVNCGVVSDKGCTAAAPALTVRSFALPKADFTFEQLVSRGMETDHKLTFTGSGASGYVWSFYDGSTDFTGGPVFKTFTDTGHKPVKLWVVNTDGCRDSITKLIYLKPELQMWIVGSFSPNNDGLNETFGPSTVFGLSKYHMKIYDRWGEKLFESKDPKMPWDGRDKKGDPVPEGVYAYEISFRYIDGKIFVYQGTLTLLR